MSDKVSKKKHRWLKRLIISVLLICIIISGGSYFVLNFFKINTITFEGTDKYTDEELKEYIFDGFGSSFNMLKLAYDTKNKPKAEIPFIETYEINLDYPDTVHVVLYEKSIVAYVLYKGNYMYIDKDGIVVESSTTLLKNVPLVDGLDFNSIVLYSPLPVEKGEVFNTILDLSQSMQKYELAVDKIFFEDDLSIVLYMAQVRVNLGKGDNLSEKLHELKQMEKELVGLSGTLHMENYTKDNSFITFKKDE